MHAAAGCGTARARLRDAKCTVRLSCRLDARPQRPPRDESFGYAGALGDLSAIGPAVDPAARRLVPENDLSARARFEWNRRQLRPQPAFADALSAAAHAGAGALPVRKRLRRSPLAPSPRRRYCRNHDTARLRAPWRLPWRFRTPSRGSPAQSLPAQAARARQGTSARRDGPRRTTRRAVAEGPPARKPADRRPSRSSAVRRRKRRLAAAPSARRRAAIWIATRTARFRRQRRAPKGRR